MISERIRSTYRPDGIVAMSPRHLAVAMLSEDPEYQEWMEKRGSYLDNERRRLLDEISALEKEYEKYDSEWNEILSKSVERLMPTAEQDLQEFIQEYIRKNLRKEEEFIHDQEISEETGDR